MNSVDAALDDLVDAWHRGGWPECSLEDLIRERTGWSHLEFADWTVRGRVLPAVQVLDTFNVKGRGLAFVIVAPEPPLTVGDLCRVDGELHRVTGVEQFMSHPPKSVVDGKQGVLLRREP
jgi:hypothetical protein